MPTLSELIAQKKPQPARPAGMILNDKPVPKPAAPPEDPGPRSLSTTEGETIDMTPVSASKAEQTWHSALNAFESELCLMTDPKDPERAWIAVRLDGQEEWPILLKSFPLYQHPRTVRPDNEPF